MTPCEENKTTSGRILGVCYILSTTNQTHGGSTGGTISPHVRCIEHNRGVTQRVAAPLLGGLQRAVAPLHGVYGSTPRIFFLYICRTKDGGSTQRWWVNLPMVLCMGVAHGFGHVGFLPKVFCRSGQGSYGYVLI